MSFEPDVTEEGAAEVQTDAAPVKAPAEPSEEVEEMPAEATEVASESPPAAPQAGGKRTQFRIVRESIQNLEIEVGRYRKSHEASAKKLEAQVASLRKEFVTHIRSKESGAHVKTQKLDTKRLEKQITSLRSDLASLRSQMAKEAAKSRAREEVALSRIISKVKAVRPAKRPKAKTLKKKR